jgi:signal transduction histidine kinase
MKPSRRRAALSRAQDVALAAGACALDLVLNFSSVVRSDPMAYRLPTVAILGYAAAGYTALIWRRHAPEVVFAVLWLHSVVSTQLGGYSAAVGLAIALYTVATRRGTRTARLALLATGLPAGLMVVKAVDSAPPRYLSTALLGTTVVLALAYGSAWIAGRRRRQTDLEHRRQLEAREMVIAERTRIARELHDILAHSVTVMLLQAAGAQRLLRIDLARADQALGQVGECGARAMGELDRTLRALRAEEAGDAGPLLGLADLDALVAEVRRAGIPVTVEIAGVRRPVHPGVDLTAYRLVQEALTNVAKHAGAGARATVRIRWADDLLVEVRNDRGGVVGHPTAGLSTRHGLRGLAERVAAAGGRLEAAPTADGGFRLAATLPIARSPSEPHPAPAPPTT